MTGRVYGIGLGPGDPELMTLKAHRLIASAKVIAYPSLAGGESFARAIAADVIPVGCTEIAISIPMSVERKPAQDAYDSGAAHIAAALDAGNDVVVLCEGDPFFYGSFMYLYSRLSADYEVSVVPGVTSVTACAASVGRPLSARNEVLTIIPAPLDQDELQTRVAAADAIAIMKVGRHLPKIRAVLDGLDLTDRAVYVERATLKNEQWMPLADAPETAPYFSMILVTKGTDPWL